MKDMFLTDRKLDRRITEVKKYRYRNIRNLEAFAVQEDLQGVVNPQVPAEFDNWDTIHTGDCWSGRDRYLWMHKDIEIPAQWKGQRVVGIFDFGNTGAGNNSGFEAMCYIDGKPYQGVDVNHKEVFFPEELCGKTVNLTFRLWSGLEGGGVPAVQEHKIRQADLACLDEPADDFYYMGTLILDTIANLEEGNPVKYDLRNALDQACHCIDWSYPGSESFYDSLHQADQILNEKIDKMEKHSPVNVYCVGHTHIDMAWLWRLKHTHEKASRSFSTVLRMMEMFPEYIFLQTQPQIYEYIKEDFPEIFEEIRKRVKEGRWEADGGMWVEADCNLTSGESLTRQLLIGSRFLKEEFGKDVEYLWLPDVFGYSWALPQILKKSGIDVFMTTKISWNQYNAMPDDLFWWRGIDGSQVLTYFVNTPGEGQDVSTRYATYNGMVTPHAVLGSWRKFKNKDLSRDTLIPYGFGDGGGGVTRDMLELRRVMERLPGLPHVKPDTAGAFFRKMHENVDATDRYVHTWDGELYLEYHRGTYTSQAYNKKTNRRMEQKLAQAEWLASTAYALGEAYPAKELHESWECVLLHQFHDIIPGSSIHEVYEDSRVNYRMAEERADRTRNRMLAVLTERKEHRYGVFSVNSFGGEELVRIGTDGCGSFRDENGQPLKAQQTENGYDVRMDITPFAVKHITFVPGGETEPGKAFSVLDHGIETPFYSILWNEEGQLIRLYDKEAARSVLKEGEKGNVLEVYEDKPMNYDAWDIDLYYTQKMETMAVCCPPEIVAEGGLKAVIRFTYRYRKSRVVQDMTVYRDSRRIDFRTLVDWHEDHRLLKAAFYTDVRSTKATYDIQFGHVERPTHWNNSWGWARFEVCGHKWADLSETGYGVSLLNDCKYGYSIKGHAMKLSLLKSAKHPDTSADMGEHEFTYALYPHRGSVTEGGTIEEANRLNLPAQAVPGEFRDTRRLVKVSEDCIQIDAVKKAEDEECLIVRIHECRGGHGRAVLESEFPVKRIVPCNLLEHDSGEAVEGNRISVSVHPFEIKTYKMYLAK